MWHYVRATYVFCLASVMISCISGCSYAYPFSLSVKIRSNEDNRLLEGVKVTLKARLFEAPEFPVSTGSDGTVNFKFRVRDIEFMHETLPKWTLVLSKEGYRDEEVDISLNNKPESPKMETQLIANAFMRPN